KAYAQYLLGVEQANLRTLDGLRRSVDHLNRSIAIDSAFAPAWATLATAHGLGLIYYTTTPDSARAVIARATERALALDDRLGDPLVARGMMHFVVEWDFGAAERDFAQGMARNPTTLAQSLHGWYLWETGQFAKAIALHERLIDLEPATAQWYSDLGWDHWASGDTARAFAAARRAIALDSLFFEAHHELAWMSVETGDFVTARREIDIARRLAGGDYWLRQVVEGQLLARAGDEAGARRVLQAMDRDPRLAQRALLLATLGERDSMYVMLEQAIDARDPDVLWMMNAERVLRGLRQEPRYQQLLARMGLPEALRR
ncbi:MAG TPA: hypothetical protein VFY20_09180, partial [Gemmatimonadales bacterium]|nr:hypothetical protein [Gemmatimonadales bacterium]